MRPQILYPLFKPVTTLKGVGPRIAKAMERACGPDIVDLLWHLPQGLVDRRYQPSIIEAKAGRIATIEVSVGKHEPAHNKRMPYRVRCFDESGELTLVFFHAHTDYLQKTLPEGAVRVVSGQIEHYQGAVQITHPDHVVKPEELESILRIEPVYGLSAGISQKVMVKAVTGALEHAPELPEWLDAEHIKRENWPDWKTALLAAHHPGDIADLDPATAARQRMAYDELLSNQLALALVRRGMRRAKGRALMGNGALRQRVTDALPFDLTGSQTQALAEIDADLSGDVRMLRLLQGDVGSGKTVVALLAMLSAVEAGAQAVLMAPTDVLVRQHMKTIQPLCESIGIDVQLLTGREKGKNREGILARLKSGEAQIAIGTHALFQDDVEFADLRIAVIDEQHRFGVHQRLSLAAKGAAVDVLVMTATPIPRTLMLTAYGDMDVSRLTEKPAGRKPVDTRVMPASKLEDVANALKRKLDQGEKAFWVCPLVEVTEKLDLAAAEDRYETLKKRFGDRVGLVHGRMKGKEKDAAMVAFKEGSIDILVATTVIEVGVDIPDATVMVVEHAERFGLSQLHQLRGRIGRGERASTCLLMYQPPLGQTAKARLETLRDTEDGFVIAEKDLELRGAGEMLGTRQSGLPDFRLADLARHQDLIVTARGDAELILNRDPDLESDRGKALKVLLYLFERDAAVHYLRSG